MTQTLIIMQGVPGSGKSTKAHELADEYGAVVYSTDDFFMKDGEYQFVFAELKTNHQKNITRAKAALSAGVNVIVDNTNIKAWEALPYVEFAHELGDIDIQFIRCDGSFKNTHGVPDNIVNDMRSRMEELTLDSVMSSEIPSYAK